MKRLLNVRRVDLVPSGGDAAGSSEEPRATTFAGRVRDRVAQSPWWESSGGYFPYGGALVAILLLIHPLGLVWNLDGPLSDRIERTIDMSLLLQNVAIFGSSVILLYVWRLSHSPAVGWISAALAMVAVQNLPFALLAVAGSPDGGFGAINGVTSIPVRLAMLAMLWLAMTGRQEPLSNPMLIGVPIGVAIAVARLALVAQDADPSLTVTIWRHALVQAGVVTVTLLIGLALARIDVLPYWVRLRLIVALFLFTAGASFPPGPHGEPASIVRLILEILGITLLVATSLALARFTFQANARGLVTLAHRAATAEAAVRHGQERLHELNATVAGVAQASRLLLQDGGPTGSRRVRLQELLDAEMARLERMLAERRTEEPVPIAVDDVVGPLVGIQRTLGHEIDWTPGGLHGIGRADDLSEVVHILLTNAARHAIGSRVEVTSRVAGKRSAAMIEIRVADEGPGVDPRLQRQLFDWGTRRPGSPGQGIGLQLARRLMVEQGGDLRLEQRSDQRSGAVFVISLPAASAEQAESLSSGPEGESASA